MLRSDNGKYVFYTHKVTFKNNGQTIVDYTDDTSSYVDMVNRFPDRLTDLVTEELVPTEEQKARLEQLNTFDLNKIDIGYSAQVLFVDKGVVTTDTPQLHALFEENKDRTVSFLVENLAPELKNIRDQHLLDGMVLDGIRFDCDDKAIANATGYVVMCREFIASGIPEDEVNKKQFPWKTYDNTYINLTFPGIRKLSLTLAAYVQAAFGTEDKVLELLKTKSVAELCAFEKNKQYAEPKKLDAVAIERGEEAGEVPVVEEVEAPSLKELFTSTFTVVFEAIKPM